MTFFSFVLLQVAFIAIVVPCAIAFARLQSWLLSSSEFFHQLSSHSPNAAVVFLWILPTLFVTLLILNAVSRYFVEFERAT
jgi:hypothetical protein